MNNKQSMKLYTEEQVKQMIEKSRETGLTAEYLVLANKGIELPSDEEIEIENGYNPTEMYDLGYLDGAKWMRDKIQGSNNEQQ